MMGARTAERVMPPLTQTASEALWGRSFSSSDASTSGRSSQTTSSRLNDDDVVVILSDESAATEAAPLVSHNAVKLALCGGVSGALAKTCTAPLARLTILYQVKGLALAGPGAGGAQLGVFAALRHIAATEGVTALWRGNLVTIMHRIPYSATNFFTYESAKRALQGRLPNEPARAWAAGAVSGLVACTAAYPLDLLRTRIAADTSSATTTRGSPHLPPRQHPPHYPHHQQQQPYRRIRTALRRILAEQGVRGLYKGLSATLVQVVPGLAFQFCFYDTFKSLALQLQAGQQGQLGQLRHRLAPHSAPQQGQQGHQGSMLLQPSSPPSVPSPAQSHHRHPEQQQQQQGHFQQLEPQHRVQGQQGQQGHQGQQGQQGPAHSGGSCSDGGGGGGGGARGSGACGTPAAAAAAALSPPPSPSPLTSAVCACLSGLCTSSLTFPLDVVRRRLQVYERGALGRLRYLDVVRAVASEGGMAAFYRGLGPEYLKVLPGMAIAFTTYETMKQLTGAA